ncbi:MAG: 30S ribosomal protein S2 [Candidatus Micrarchaeia archaeon]
MLTTQEEYMESGIHIGTRLKTPYMSMFIYRIRPDKLFVMNLEGIDERIQAAAELIARYDPDKVLVVASRLYAIDAAKKFCDVVGCKFVQGRFQPGTLTNPKSKHFIEPDLLIVSDPRTEIQALKEAAYRGIPTIGLVDTDNSARYIDLVIPCNNKGKKSLNLVYKLLAVTVLTLRGDKEGAAKAKKMFEEEVESEESSEEIAEKIESKAAAEKKEELKKTSKKKKEE